jgi:hypothetical protein
MMVVVGGHPEKPAPFSWGMNDAPFEAPDTLAPYVERVKAHLAQNPGSTPAEIQKATKLGENVVRAALDRLAWAKQVHCTLRRQPRGGPPREYHLGPCPIVTEPTVH